MYSLWQNGLYCGQMLQATWFSTKIQVQEQKNAIAHQVSPNIEPNQGNQSNGVFDFASILHTSQTHD